MNEENSKAVLPNVGSIDEPAPHISVEVLSEYSRQIDEQLKKNLGIRNQLQQTFNEVQKQLGQSNINDTALNAQKSAIEEAKKKIIELLAPPKT